MGSMRLPERVLAPVERISEILFDLIVALTITGAVSVTTADRLQIRRTMLIAALGCNLAWGIIDAVMYLMARLGERGRMALVARTLRETTDHETARRMIANELPPPLDSILQQPQLELIREKIDQLPHAGPGLSGRDWLGALGVFALVVLSTFPVVIPFLFIENARWALRTSNALAVAMLFLCGFFFARYAGLRPWTTGLLMVIIGAALVGIAIALGG